MPTERQTYCCCGKTKYIDRYIEMQMEKKIKKQESCLLTKRRRS